MLAWVDPLAGFGVGLVVGLTGVGGGSLMTPVLVLLLGVAPATAVGTDLWFAALTKLAGSAVHQGHGAVDWQVLRRLWLGSLPTSLALLVWLHVGTGPRMQSPWVLHLLGVVLLLTAAAMLLRGQAQALGRTLRLQDAARFKRWQPVLTVLAGVVLGGLVTLTSVGAGALGVVLLVYLYPLRMTGARLVATDIAHAIPLTLLAGSGHALLGHVELGLLGRLLLGSVPGVMLGAALAHRTPERLLRPGIALMLLLVGGKLVAG
ncbi:MAG: sulfite exporter TauE/SafE family protein [Rubrivivax sp.]|jgi:uncharacterized membrane protein YfcA|nr:sulfite exporter TauE/SafE family protein [Rubrivivax sp.]